MSGGFAPRHGLLAVALLITLVAAFLPQDEGLEDEGVVEVAERPGPTSQAQQPASPVSYAQDGRSDFSPTSRAQDRSTAQNYSGPVNRDLRVAPKPLADLFPAQSFRPPPPPPPPARPAPPPPPPTAPALPFKFVGAWQEDGRDTVFAAIKALERAHAPLYWLEPLLREEVALFAAIDVVAGGITGALDEGSFGARQRALHEQGSRA